MTFTCQQIDDLMMDFLYRELDVAQTKAYREHLAGCASCAAQLAGYEQTRTMMQALPAQEPPVAVSAKLLRAAAERPRGVWSRFAAWLSPLTAHPGVAAVATFVVVAGVAGFLVARHGIPDRATSSRLAADNVAFQRAATPATEVEGMVAGAPAAASADEAPAAAAPATPPADSFADVAETKKSKAALEDKGVVRLAENDRKEAARQGGATFATPPRGAATGAMEASKDANREEAADLDDALAQAPAEDRVGAANRALPKKPSVKPTDAAKADLARRADAPPPPAVASAGPKAPAEPSAPAAAPAPAPVARPEAEAAPGKTTDTPTVADARVLHGQARGKAAGGDCNSVMTLRSRIAKIDPAYYDRNVRNDPDLAKCTAGVKKGRSAKPEAAPSRDTDVDAKPATSE